MTEIYALSYANGPATYERFLRTVDDIARLPAVNPDKALALIAIALSRCSSPEFLMYLAAGPLEEVLRDPIPDILERVVAEGRRSARFRWLLSGIWPHAMATAAHEVITPLLADVSSENPPPPLDESADRT